MRRFRQQLAPEEAKEILDCGTNGILSLVDSDGAPYGVPVSYAYDGDGHIYLHSAMAGHKINCINSDSRCSFCVVALDHVVPEEFTTYFRSVIVAGRISILTDAREVHDALIHLCDKYCPGIDPTAEIARFAKTVRALRIDIEKITGKESVELMRQRGEWAGGY